jgi:hypothetical protein
MSDSEMSMKFNESFPSRSQTRWVLVPRLVAAAIGMILLTACLLKAWDMELFIRQLKGYGVISQRPLLVLSAWGMIALQFTLGVGLLIFYRPALTLSLTSLLWLILIGGTASAWYLGTTEDCGCFGTWLKHSPKEAFFYNLCLLAATIMTLIACRAMSVSIIPKGGWVVFIAAVVGVALPPAFGFSISSISKHDPNAAIVDMSEIQIEGLDGIDLGSGAYLIMLMGTECPHCRESVPDLNLLAEIPDIPDVVALCTVDEPERTLFVEELQPNFPLGQIDEKDFLRLLGDGDVPRFLLLKEGRVQRIWDEVVPDLETVLTALSNN